MKQAKSALRRTACALFLALCLMGQAAAQTPDFLIAGGNTIGIKLYTKGLLITQVAGSSAAQTAGLREGDTITQVDGAPATTAQGLREKLQDGKAVVLTLQRDGQQAQFLVQPEQTPEGYRLGIGIRDHIAGIGTVTYYDPESGAFGALGHGVGGMGAAELLPMSAGVAVAANVDSVRRGSAGSPGALKGSFDLRAPVGSITQNLPQGVFGVMYAVPQREAMAVGKSGEVRTGGANILSNVSGSTVESFEIEIEKIEPNAKNGRNLLLRVTDERLLETTGGIVQGMSGSPIIQDGKLVGAVTHVLVNDPTRGYGIFIENMLEAAG